MTKHPVQLFENWKSVGEAVKHVPDEIRIQYPNIPWKNLAGLRDRLIHGYFGINYKIVWNTIIMELPTIAKSISLIISQLNRNAK